jgi:FO synthase
MTDGLLDLPLPDLMARARQIRDQAHGTRVTFSPKVFIPLTMLCRDKCGYCTFAQPPARLEAPFLTPDQVLAIARAGAAAGCHEALFTLGAPRSSVPIAAEWLACERLRVDHRLPRRDGPHGHRRDRLAPHASAGAVHRRARALRVVSASGG